MRHIALVPYAVAVPVAAHRRDEPDVTEMLAVEVTRLGEVREHHDRCFGVDRREVVREPAILRIVVAVAAPTFAVVYDEMTRTPVEREIRRPDDVDPRLAS